MSPTVFAMFSSLRLSTHERRPRPLAAGRLRRRLARQETT
jgi:hypothetical protein